MVNLLFEVVFGLTVFALFCLWHSFWGDDAQMLHFLIYYVSIALLQVLISDDDYGVFLLTASLLYDCCFGYFFGFYSLGVLAYAALLRPMIYVYLHEHIHDLYCLISFLMMLYFSATALTYIVSFFQSMLLPWYIQGM